MIYFRGYSIVIFVVCWFIPPYPAAAGNSESFLVEPSKQTKPIPFEAKSEMDVAVPL